jgi:hypothetical protein
VSLPRAATLQNDFGTAADPGSNTFRCNSAAATLQAVGPGGDVFANVGEPAGAGVVLSFEGNTWDHAPPSTAISAAATDPASGIDLFVFGGAGFNGPTVDTAGADASSTPACPAGRVAGPTGL